MATTKKTPVKRPVYKAPRPRVDGREIKQFRTREEARYAARLAGKPVRDMSDVDFWCCSNATCNDSLRWFYFVE